MLQRGYTIFRPSDSGVGWPGFFMDLLIDLRESTRAQHVRIESAVDLLNADLKLARYERLLAAFYGLYAPLERRLHRVADLDRDLRLERRHKSPALERDLRALGIRPETVPLCPVLPEIGTSDRAYGCMYVLEGATLGGQIISRHVSRTLGLTPERGCAFFSSYGPEVGAMWREFGRVLRSHPIRDRGSVIAAARETFECFHAWLTDGTPTLEHC